MEVNENRQECIKIYEDVMETYENVMDKVGNEWNCDAYGKNWPEHD